MLESVYVKSMKCFEVKTITCIKQNRQRNACHSKLVKDYFLSSNYQFYIDQNLFVSGPFSCVELQNSYSRNIFSLREVVHVPGLSCPSVTRCSGPLCRW